ncbi:MAG TPA: chemotaxis protein CheW [Geobacteraceae bacterium]
MINPDRLVVFTLDDYRYAVPLPAVEQAVRVVEITPLPQAPDMVIGVINLRGRIIPVLNIRKRFRLPERERALSDQLLIACTARRTVALVVDGVSDVIEHSAQETTAPARISPGLEYVTGVVKLKDGMIFIHDLDEFLSLEEEGELDAAIGAGNISGDA